MQDDRKQPQDPVEIFHLLKRNLGRELVTDANVGALIAIARQEGHQLLERELREWQAPCGGATRDGPASTIPPTRGFNKEHVRH